jgi:hypothetical protein
MITLEQVLYILPLIGLTRSLLYYGMILRNSNKTQQIALETRQLQLYMQVLGKLGTREFIKHYIEIMYDHDYRSYEEWRDKYGPRTNPEAYISYYYVTGMYQNLAHLVRDNVLSIETLAEQDRPRAIISLWEKIQPVVLYHREHFNPNAYDALEHLHDEMKSRTRAAYIVPLTEMICEPL